MTEAEPTVFVVDDDPSVRRSMERLVRSMGFNVQTFATAKEFTERARVESPSCLVLDVQLPGPSGLDLQRELVQAGVQIPDHLHHGTRQHPDVRPRDEGWRGRVPDQAGPARGTCSPRFAPRSSAIARRTRRAASWTGCESGTRG